MLAAAADGQPGIALLSGEAGIGKTRLVGALETRARERGFVVLHGVVAGAAADRQARAILRELHDPLERHAALPSELPANTTKPYPAVASSSRVAVSEA